MMMIINDGKKRTTEPLELVDVKPTFATNPKSGGCQVEKQTNENKMY